MKQWTIKAKRPKRDLYKKFRASRVHSIQAYELVRDEHDDKWSLQALFGLYVAMYEERYKRKWFLSAQASAEVVNDLRLLVVRESMITAIASVRVIFMSQKLRWIMTNHSDMLADRSKYQQYVHPVVFETRPHGEQAEWSGKRGEAGAELVKAKEFFE